MFLLTICGGSLNYCTKGWHITRNKVKTKPGARIVSSALNSHNSQTNHTHALYFIVKVTEVYEVRQVMILLSNILKPSKDINTYYTSFMRQAERLLLAVSYKRDEVWFCNFRGDFYEQFLSLGKTFTSILSLLFSTEGNIKFLSYVTSPNLNLHYYTSANELTKTILAIALVLFTFFLYILLLAMCISSYQCPYSIESYELLP